MLLGLLSWFLSVRLAPRSNGSRMARFHMPAVRDHGAQIGPAHRRLFSVHRDRGMFTGRPEVIVPLLGLASPWS